MSRGSPALTESRKEKLSMRVAPTAAPIRSRAREVGSIIPRACRQRKPVPRGDGLSLSNPTLGRAAPRCTQMKPMHPNTQSAKDTIACPVD